MLVGCSGLFWECRDTPHPMVEIPQGWGPTQTHVCPPFPPPPGGDMAMGPWYGCCTQTSPSVGSGLKWFIRTSRRAGGPLQRRHRSEGSQ